MSSSTYSEYDASTGFFTGRIFTTDERENVVQFRGGYNYALGEWNSDLYSVDPATLDLIEPDAATIATYLARPSYAAHWDRVLRQWVDDRTIRTFRGERLQAIKTEMSRRMAAVLPGFGNVETVRALREVWLSIAPAARQPTAKLTSIINIYQAGDVAITAVRAATTKADVDAVVVNWPT